MQISGCKLCTLALTSGVLLLCCWNASKGRPVGEIVEATYHATRLTTVGKRYLLPREAYPKARCLDGTSPVVYIRRNPSSTKWLLFLEGWGFCHSLHDCLERSYTSHGSTKGEPHFLDLRQHGPYFSADKHENPLLHDFNWVFIRYCDGGYFSGDVSAPVVVSTGELSTQIYFQGRFIREAVVDFLRTRHEMDSATDAIMAGCSSGAITVLFSMNVWRRLLHWIPRVSTFADSGYYLDIDHEYSSQKMFIYKHQNASASLVPECVREHADRPWACFVASNALPYALTPAFLLQSRYDTDQLNGLCQTDAVRCINQYGASLAASIQAALENHSFFIDGCSRHCSGSGPALDANGISQVQALYQWYHNVRVHIMQAGRYPCSTCCSPDYDIRFW